jgi:phospholipase/carboxylesterase
MRCVGLLGLAIAVACSQSKPASKELTYKMVGQGDGPLVVLLHGYGAPPDDLVGLAPRPGVPAGTRYVFPGAPHVVPGYGFGWWPIDMGHVQRELRAGNDRVFADERPAGMIASRDQVIALLERLSREQRVPLNRIVLGGLSQGAMLAAEVALHLREPPGALVLWSPALLSESEWRARAARLRGVPVLISHGRQDRILPFSQAKALAELLRGGGAVVKFLEFEGGHSIPDQALTELDALTSRPVAPPPQTAR